MNEKMFELTGKLERVLDSENFQNVLNNNSIVVFIRGRKIIIYAAGYEYYIVK
jgi:hypothetical protein